MIDLKIQILRYCIAVAETGSFHAAARQLKRTQPALSSAIRDFESKLGQPLFERGSQAKLTAFGQYALPQFKSLTRKHDKIAEQIERFSAGQQGDLSLAAVPSVANRLLPIWLSEFIVRFPELRMNAIDATSDLVCKMVVDDEVELGIGSLQEPDERLHYLPLSRDRLGVVCHHKHPLAQRSEVAWEQLLGQGLIRNTSMDILKGTQAAPLLTDSSISINNMISLLSMIRHHRGLTLLPEMAVPSQDPDIIFIPLAEPDFERSVGLITRAGRVLSPAAVQFIQHVLQSITFLPPLAKPLMA